MQLLQGRSDEVRRQIANRLREEAGYYVLMLGFALVVSLTKLSWWTMAYLLVLTVTIGLLIATLRHQARRMRSIDLGGDLRQTLQALLSRVDRATRAYMAAYLLVTAGQLALGGMAFLLHKEPAVIALGAAGGLAAMALIWWSGRSYLESRFGSYRAQLARCLAELG